MSNALARSRFELKADLRWGLKGAFSFAAVYCGWVIIVFLVRGTGPFDHLGVTFLGVELMYVATAAIGGVLVGALRPLTASTAGAYFVGILAGVILITGTTILLSGMPWRWG